MCIWIIVSALALYAALQMDDLFRFQRFADMLKDRRPKAHTFN